MLLRFFFRLFRRAENAERMRARWERAPDVPIAERLARTLLDAQRAADAVSFLRQALQVFPHARTLRAYHARARRLHSAEEIRALREALAAEPRPALYARLAELYRFLGQLEEALETAREGMRLFPAFGGNYLAVGRVHYSRFLKTCSAQDGHQADAYLTKALAFDPHNFKTLFHLASLHAMVGSARRARAYTEELEHLVPGDTRVADLVRRVKELPDVPEDGAVDCFSRYEALRLDGGASPRGVRAALRTGEALDAHVAHLSTVRGVKGLLLTDAHGKPLGGSVDGIDASPLHAAVNGMLEGARVNCRRMTLGTFNEAVLVSRQWKVFLYDFDGIGLAVFGDRAARHDLVERKVNDFVQECLCEVPAS